MTNDTQQHHFEKRALAFAAAANTGVGVSPWPIAVGDFNSDGNLDIVVANTGVNTVQALLGDGAGGFTAGAAVAVGANSRGIAVGDFNNDNKLDVVTANGGINTMSLLIGNGDGTFMNSVNFAAGDAPYGIAVGDFNEDGRLDAIVGSTASNNVNLLINNGAGGFNAAVSYFIAFARDVAVDDINKDGHLDIAVTNIASANVNVRLGDGVGNFDGSTSFGVGTNPAGVAIKDLNGDGHLDIVTANRDSDNISVLLGNGVGGFATASNYAVGNSPYDVAIADFDGDCKLDIAAVNSFSSTVSVLLGNGAGGFGTATNYNIGINSQGITVGDFNKDGKPDIAVTNLDNANVSVLINQSVNAAPVLTSSAGSLAYIEGQAAIAINPGLTLSDDSAILVRATVAITSNFAADQDILAFTNTAKITGSYNAATGVLTLTGKDTIANYQTALQRVTYVNSSQNPSGLTRTVTFTANDCNAISTGTTTRDIVVTPIDNQPILVNNSLTVAEGNSVIITSTDMYATDIDNTVNELSFTVSNLQHGRFELISAPSVAITQFTQAQINAGQVRFVQDGSDNAPSYQLSVSDGVLSTTPIAATINFIGIMDTRSISASADITRTHHRKSPSLASRSARPEKTRHEASASQLSAMPDVTSSLMLIPVLAKMGTNAVNSLLSIGKNWWNGDSNAEVLSMSAEELKQAQASLAKLEVHIEQLLSQASQDTWYRYGLDDLKEELQSTDKRNISLAQVKEWQAELAELEADYTPAIVAQAAASTWSHSFFKPVQQPVVMPEQAALPTTAHRQIAV